MISFKKAVLSTAFILGLISIQAPAQADVFYWHDAQTKMSFSYPDRWEAAHNQKPDDVLTVLAPGPSDLASCRFRVREDHRFAMYPQSYADNITRTELGEQFWEDYLAENQTYKIHNHRTDAGLGRGYASMALSTYVSFDDPNRVKQAITFASIYNNKIYIVDCSAKIDVFAQYYPRFTSIIKSVNFRKEIHQFSGGDYRHFLDDCKTWVRNGPGDTGIKQYW